MIVFGKKVSGKDAVKGLMYIKKPLWNNNGMLFDMADHPKNHSMWMKDTLIPLDIIFLDREYNVVGVIHNTEPLSERSLFVNKMSYYIIETNAGFCNKYHIVSGMNITDKFNLVTIQ
mgnify:CR=1 FL=1